MAKGKGSGGISGQPGAGKTAAGASTVQATKQQLKQNKAAQSKNLLGAATAAAGGNFGEAENRLAEVDKLKKQEDQLRDKLKRKDQPSSRKREELLNRAEDRFRQIEQNGKAFDSFAEKNFYNSWQKKLTAPEINGIQTYTGSSYFDLNANLHKGLALSDSQKTAVSNIDKALKRASARTPYDMVIYRSFSSSDMYKQLQERRGKLDGGVFKYDGYSSSTLSKEFAGKWSGKFKLKILLPKGSQGAYISYSKDQLSTASLSERELLLPRGTKFKVIRTKLGQKWKGASSSHTELVVRAYTPNHPDYKKIDADF